MAVGLWIFDRVANSGLGGEMDDPFRSLCREELRCSIRVSEVELEVSVARGFGKSLQPRLLE